MSFNLLTLFAITIFSLTTSTTSHFFPNISAIPPSLIPNATEIAWNSFQKYRGCHRGEKSDGLAKLKQYFQHFGYIHDPSSSNFTDDFDDAFESALKIYQHNFNLKESGELDEDTVSQIVRPRCGVADIINGSSSMNSGKSVTSNGLIHSVKHYSFFPGTPRWPASKRKLTYGFVPENELSDTVKSVFTRAFVRWSEVTPLTFSESSSYYTADIKIGFFTGDHGDGEPFDGVLGTLAHAFSPPSGRFHLDGAENWVITGDVATSSLSSSSAIDLESVAIHEIGHLLGLGHSSVESAIMYPTISSGSQKTQLASDDIEGIQQLYGENPNYNSSSTPATQQGETSGSGGSAYPVAPGWGRIWTVMAIGCFVLIF